MKLTKIQQQLVDNGFYFAKVTMYRQDPSTGGKSDIIDTYEGLIKQHESGIVYKYREGARSRNLTTILTVSQRLISIEKMDIS